MVYRTCNGLQRGPISPSLIMTNGQIVKENVQRIANVQQNKNYSNFVSPYPNTIVPHSSQTNVPLTQRNLNARNPKSILPKIELQAINQRILPQNGDFFAVVTPTATSPSIGDMNAYHVPVDTLSIQSSGFTQKERHSPILFASNITPSKPHLPVFPLPSSAYNSVTPILPSVAFQADFAPSNSIEDSRDEKYSDDKRISKRSGAIRLNKFVRRLHNMLKAEQELGIVEWRKGLLVLHSTDTFAKKVLPKYFNTKNFKTFRRQLNYYGFVHVRSFSATGSTTTALWVNQDLAKRGTDSISSVLMLKRMEPCESTKTAEGRRIRKEKAVSTVEDISVSTRVIQLEQIRNIAVHNQNNIDANRNGARASRMVPVPTIAMIADYNIIPDYNNFLSSQNSPIVSSSLPPVSLTKYPQDGVQHYAYSSANDAANLLIMLSKSVVPPL